MHTSRQVKHQGDKFGGNGPPLAAAYALLLCLRAVLPRVCAAHALLALTRCLRCACLLAGYPRVRAAHPECICTGPLVRAPCQCTAAGPLIAAALSDIHKRDIDITYIGAMGDKEVLPIYQARC